MQVDRSTVRYQSKRGNDAELRDAIKRVARERRQFGILTVVDDFTKENVALVAYRPISGLRVTRELDPATCKTPDRSQYNKVQIHKGLLTLIGNLTPFEFVNEMRMDKLAA